MYDFDVLLINLEGSDERLESVRNMLYAEQINWRRSPQLMVAMVCQREITTTTKQRRLSGMIGQ